VTLRFAPRFTRTCLAAMTGLMALGAVATPALAAPGPTMYVNQLTPYLEQKLDKGEVVVLIKQRHPIYDLDVYGTIDGSADQVWRAVTSYDNYHEFLPLVTDSALRKRSGNMAYQYVRMNPPWPFTEKWMVNAHREDKVRGRISWEQAEGNVKFEKGFWAVTPVGPNKTRLQYHLTVDPWMDSMPGWLVDMTSKSIMPAIVNGVRRRVKQDQQARK
jgi:ribosome-associated toxin RatA of RatAB toxin-antitoxin module